MKGNSVNFFMESYNHKILMNSYQIITLFGVPVRDEVARKIFTAH